MLVHGKGNKQRTVYLEKKAIQALRAHLADRPGSPDQPSSYIIRALASLCEG
jgi:site-specific recombinase XerD